MTYRPRKMLSELKFTCNLHVVVHPHGVCQLPPMDPRSNCSHAYIKEYQKEHTFTIPFASKNISLACNRLFRPLKLTISKPLSWDKSTGIWFWARGFQFQTHLETKLENCGLKLGVKAFECFYNLKFEPTQLQIYEPHKCEQPHLNEWAED
jgi:hypothetical protein